MKIFFIRHGESLANERDILASRQDFSLSQRGIIDVNHIAQQFLEDLGPLDGIISSPLARARETAEPFCSLMNLKLEVNDSITEQELGEYAGMSYGQLENAPGYEHERTKRWDWVPRGGGESYSMIARRLEPFFALMEERALKCHHDSILVVTHAVTLRLIRATLEKTLPLYPSEIAKNGEIWEVDFTTAQKTYGLKIHLLGNAGIRNSKA